MGKIALYLVLAAISIVALRRPWIGIVGTYFFIVSSIGVVFHWWFTGVEPVKLIMIPTIVGSVLAVLNGSVRLSALKSKQNFLICVLWVAIAISYFFGAYVRADSEFFVFPAPVVFGWVNTMFITYFLAALLIDSEKKVQYFVFVIFVSAIFHTYLINKTYLLEGLGPVGRIGAPRAPQGGGLYGDENNYAMLFVIGQPYLFYLSYMFKKKFWRYACWLVIPFTWHAIFLTGSRGGLLAAIFLIGIFSIRTKNKILPFVAIILFVIAFVTQSGDIMSGRARTIASYQEDASAMGRIEAWKAAIEMAKDHPFTGVGIASFTAAFPSYSFGIPREAHNAFFQLLGETGVLGATAYMLLCLICISELMRTCYRMEKSGAANIHNKMYLINEALLLSFLGLIVCSSFLSLQYFDVFYMLCALVHAKKNIAKDQEPSSCTAMLSKEI